MIKEEIIEEEQMWAVAGLSLTRPISPDDVRWAIEKGFEAGIKFALNKNSESNSHQDTKPSLKDGKYHKCETKSKQKQYI